ncbi:MAG: hypothetical protein DHS20C18_15850 [Saprospiraceae bacterium]|nr:MAG: hypothetical protein DHS20C18_15850 [Saprospiraceae bacterium]
MRINTFVIILYICVVLWSNPLLDALKNAARQKWLYPFLALYLLHILSLLWTQDIEHGLFILEKKASLFLLPIAIAMDLQIKKEMVYQAMFSLIIGCSLALWFCSIYACWNYLQIADTTVFFYHELGAPLDKFNAIYFSFYAFLSLVFLFELERKSELFQGKKWLQALLLFSLLGGLVLLSSRLFILLTLLFLLFIGLRRFQSGAFPWRYKLTAILALIFLGIGILSTSFPQQRFKELRGSDFRVLQQETFHWDTPFNGLTLRLLLLKFAMEILAEKQAFLGGVGVGDAQNELDQTFIKHNLYHGNAELGDQGYLGYNTHNAFMELWLQIGIGGLFFFTIILGQAWGFSLNTGYYALVFMVLAITGFALIEGILERQRGIVLITYFLSIFYTGMKQ